jgi:hypothetical protein
MARHLERQVIERAREMISRHEQWRRAAYAMDANGERVDWCAKQAVAFCAVGALRRAAYDLSGDRNHAIRLADKIAGTMIGIGHEGLAAMKVKFINDAKGHAAVLQLFDAVVRTS